MVLAVALVLVVQRIEITLDGERRLQLQHLLGVLVGQRLLIAVRIAGGEKSVMGVIWCADMLERFDGVAVLPGHEVRAAQVIPEPLRKMRVELHRFPDPLDAFLRAAEPGKQLALLHHDGIVVGIEGEAALLMISRALVVA